MTRGVLSEAEAALQLRELACARGISNSLCPPSEKSAQEAREARQVVNTVQTANATNFHDRPIHEVNDDKTTTITYQEYLRREAERNMSPADRLLEHEVRQQMQRDEIASIRTSVLEAELAKRRAHDSETESYFSGEDDVTEAEAQAKFEAEMDAMSARIHGREVSEQKTTKTDTGDDEVTEAELDKIGASIFGRTA